MRANGDIHIPVGSVLVFRVDFEHAGSSYDVENVRVHYYAGVSPRNKTFFLADPNSSIASPTINLHLGANISGKTFKRNVYFRLK